MEYTNSKGEKLLISEMPNPYLIHAIAKLAKRIGADESDEEELLDGLKSEAIERLANLKENE